MENTKTILRVTVGESTTDAQLEQLAKMFTEALSDPNGAVLAVRDVGILGAETIPGMNSSDDALKRIVIANTQPGTSEAGLADILSKLTNAITGEDVVSEFEAVGIDRIDVFTAPKDCVDVTVVRGSSDSSEA